MDQRNRILLVDDEASIRESLRGYLTGNGFVVREAESAAAAREVLASDGCDLVVLDIMMPGEDGFSLCRHIREAQGVPVILLKARTEDTERVIGLEIGADDYVTKPFVPRELMARIRAVMRRSYSARLAVEPATATALAFAGWVLRVDERALFDREGVAVALSTGEFELLHAMLHYPRKVLSRDRLLDLSRGRAADIFDRSIDNMISRLRRKIEADPKNPAIIKTVWGDGYMLAAEVEAR
ncbi:MAG: response regulator [Pseudomonadota bacterium]